MAYPILLNDKQLRNFWSKVDKSEPGGCWLWTGLKSPEGGYGKIKFVNSDGIRKEYRATHIALMLAGQPRLDPTKFALHGDHCVSASCVNPNHLRWGTHQENMDDKVRLDRLSYGERHPQSALTNRQAYLIYHSTAKARLLAKKYGVCEGTIHRIRTGKGYVRAVRLGFPGTLESREER